MYIKQRRAPSRWKNDVEGNSVGERAVDDGGSPELGVLGSGFDRDAVEYIPAAEIAEYGMPVVNHYDSSFSFHRRSPDEFLISYYPGGYDSATRYAPEDVPDSVPSSIRREALSLAEGLFPAVDDPSIVDEWVGVRSATPDGNLIVGRTSVNGFHIAAFHTSGVQLAPAVGRIVVEQVLNGERTEFYEDVSITRFDGYHDSF
ncbi:NAD(P)/FAD-dependent oxidoreductase [Natronorubrum sp. FCH18a]|uniref:NAD(P)/FAD-dependent oxidoreductase n=1 Tax=Natronorubrum sp. FCH18a TaxID=3447018 RepID=UPI003F519281